MAWPTNKRLTHKNKESSLNSPRKKEGRQQRLKIRCGIFYVKQKMKKIIPCALVRVTSLCPLQAANNWLCETEQNIILVLKGPLWLWKKCNQQFKCAYCTRTKKKGSRKIERQTKIENKRTSEFISCGGLSNLSTIDFIDSGILYSLSRDFHTHIICSHYIWT